MIATLLAYVAYLHLRSPERSKTDPWTVLPATNFRRMNMLWISPNGRNRFGAYNGR
jgi:hypothetical protein